MATEQKSEAAPVLGREIKECDGEGDNNGRASEQGDERRASFCCGRSQERWCWGQIKFVRG